MVKSKRFGLAFLSILTVALAMMTFPASAEVAKDPVYIQVDAVSADAAEAVDTQAVESMKVENLVAPGIIGCRPGPVPGSPTGPRLCNILDEANTDELIGETVASADRYDKSTAS